MRQFYHLPASFMVFGMLNNELMSSEFRLLVWIELLFMWYGFFMNAHILCIGCRDIIRKKLLMAPGNWNKKIHLNSLFQFKEIFFLNLIVIIFRVFFSCTKSEKSVALKQKFAPNTIFLLETIWNCLKCTQTQYLTRNRIKTIFRIPPL